MSEGRSVVTVRFGLTDPPFDYGFEWETTAAEYAALVEGRADGDKEEWRAV
jgi:hypothetical protein